MHYEASLSDRPVDPPKNGVDYDLECSDGKFRRALAINDRGMVGWMIDGTDDFVSGIDAGAYEILHWTECKHHDSLSL